MHIVANVGPFSSEFVWHFLGCDKGGGGRRPTMTMYDMGVGRSKMSGILFEWHLNEKVETIKEALEINIFERTS